MSEEGNRVVTWGWLCGYLHSFNPMNTNFPCLPREVVMQIADYVFADMGTRVPGSATHRGNALIAYTAPTSAMSPLMNLPVELRRSIFAASLPARNKVHHPRCQDDLHAIFANDTNAVHKPRRNSVSDLMTLNKQICAEVAQVVYEERFFVIHVHEGIRNGGIEFQHTGRQPLQYKDSLEDARFHKFGKDDAFGFARLKKIVIEIHPATDDHGRHTAINTYFMNAALCRMLERHGDGDKEDGINKNRITSLTIRFPESASVQDVVGQTAIQWASHYWWDPEKKKPRETSVHNLSNIELVLRPFDILTGCHAVSIELPKSVRRYRPMVDFVAALTESMTSACGSMRMDDRLESKIESARYAMEEFVNYTLHGKRHHHVPNLTEAEMREAEEESEEETETLGNGKKHDLSPTSKGQMRQSKRLQQSEGVKESSKENLPSTGWDDLDGEEQRALLASHQSMLDEEDRMLATAIAASLEEENSEMETGTPQQPAPTAATTNTGRTALSGRTSRWDILPGPPSQTPVLHESPFVGSGHVLGSTRIEGGNSTSTNPGRQQTTPTPAASGGNATGRHSRYESRWDITTVQVTGQTQANEAALGNASGDLSCDGLSDPTPATITISPRPTPEHEDQDGMDEVL